MVLAGFAVSCLLLDVVIYGLARSLPGELLSSFGMEATIVAVCAFAGLVISQLVMFATLVALGDGNHAARFALGAIMVLVCTALLITGLVWLEGTRAGAGDVAGATLMVMFFFCLLQFPFWLLRWIRGWRWGVEPPDRAAPRFEIVHVLGWFAALVLPLFLYQLFVSFDEPAYSILLVVPMALFTALQGMALLSLAARCRLGMAAFLSIPIAAVPGAILALIASGGSHVLIGAASITGCWVAALNFILAVKLLDRLGVQFKTRRLMAGPALKLATLKSQNPRSDI